MTALLYGVPSQRALEQITTPCLQRLDARPWYRTLAVRTGAMHVGIRVDTAEGAAAVEQLLAPVRAPEMDAQVWPNFSVELGDLATGGSRRQLRLVYQDHEIVARRREVHEVLLDLVELLDQIPLLLVTDRPVLHATGVLTAHGEAMLLPGRLHKTLLLRRNQLAEAGLELLRTRTQRLTPAGDLELGTHDRVLADIVHRNVTDNRTLAGTRRLCVLGTPVLGNAPFDLRPAEGVFAAFSMVVNRRVIGAGATLHALSGMSEHTKVIGMPELTAGKLAHALVGITA